jgi:hypothetical protein
MGMKKQVSFHSLSSVSGIIGSLWDSKDDGSGVITLEMKVSLSCKPNAHYISSISVTLDTNHQNCASNIYELIKKEHDAFHSQRGG